MDLLNIDEAKQRLGVSESTLRRLLYSHRIEAETIDRRLYFRAQDIDQLALRRRKGDVPSQRLSSDLLERLSNAEQEIAKLRQEVEELKTAVQALSQRAQKPVAASTSSASASSITTQHRQHTSTPVEAKNTLPDGYRSFTDIFREHGIPETTANRAGSAFEVKRGNWRTATGKKVEKALDAEGQVQFCQFFSTHQAWHQCEIADCPCHGSAEQDQQ